MRRGLEARMRKLERRRSPGTIYAIEQPEGMASADALRELGIEPAVSDIIVLLQPMEDEFSEPKLVGKHPIYRRAR